MARCTVARLTRSMGLQGVVRGKAVRTTVPDPAQPCPRDGVKRQFLAPAPNRLWASDFIHVATWRGFVSFRGPLGPRPPPPFVIDACARRVVGWRVSSSATACFVLYAPEQALRERGPARGTGLDADSDRGSQYLATR